ncbi:MAG: hypothetical protein IJX98_07100 [Clostridia bacterium]|nr:hypothetical protein [Clostridia bacterium]
MRLDKREIMLNEKDSCLDTLLFMRTLISEYSAAAMRVERKELRERISEHIRELLKECYYWRDMIKRQPSM